MTTKEIGDIGEKAAARYLKKKHFRICARNRHFSHNELDIVAENKEFILFVEVKTRRVDDAEKIELTVPSSAVTYAKRTRLIEAARAYLRQKPTSKQPRMDVIEIWLDANTKKPLKINHIEDAYGA
ncbi:MAG: YraN family protein [Ruminococcaceae bacterium]|nr:YraN family protein [Oscillospiraceae bacterium]